MKSGFQHAEFEGDLHLTNACPQGHCALPLEIEYFLATYLAWWRRSADDHANISGIVLSLTGFSPVSQKRKNMPIFVNPVRSVR